MDSRTLGLNWIAMPLITAHMKRLRNLQVVSFQVKSKPLLRKQKEYWTLRNSVVFHFASHLRSKTISKELSQQICKKKSSTRKLISSLINIYVPSRIIFPHKTVSSWQRGSPSLSPPSYRVSRLEVLHHDGRTAKTFLAPRPWNFHTPDLGPARQTTATFGGGDVYKLIGLENQVVVEPTHLKNFSQIGSFPQVGVKIKNIWNHHLVNHLKSDFFLWISQRFVDLRGGCSVFFAPSCFFVKNVWWQSPLLKWESRTRSSLIARVVAWFYSKLVGNLLSPIFWCAWGVLQQSHIVPGFGDFLLKNWGS